MHRATPVRNSHTSTADLLSWPELPPQQFPAGASPIAMRSHQPSDTIGKVLFGGQITDEEADSLLKRKPRSGHKQREFNGSGIFSGDGQENASKFCTTNPNPNARTTVRTYLQNVASQISFSTEENISPKKPITLPEVAKQRELSGTLAIDPETRSRKQSDAKSKELSGNDIFGPPEASHRSVAAAAPSLKPKENKDIREPAPRAVHTSVKVSNPSGGQSSIFLGDEPYLKTPKKIHDQKFAELSGNNIFKGEGALAAGKPPRSAAKTREMSGSNIFSDGKAENRDCYGGVRQPPGGDSTISLR